MKKQKQTTIGCEHGQKYLLVYDKMCNQGAWESCCWRWFLSVWLNNKWEFLGDFGTKKESLEFLRN